MLEVKRCFRGLALVAAALCFVAWTSGAARAQSPAAPSASGNSDAAGNESSSYSVAYDVTFASKYVFQGFDYSSGEGVAQPNLSVGLGNFTFGAWGNIQPYSDVLNEIDLSLKYSKEFGKFSVAPGYMALRYPNRDWDPSQGVFVDLAMTAPLNPTLSIHYDFDAGQGSYSTLGVSHEVKAPVTLAANLFYHNQYYGMTAVPAVELKASAALSIGIYSFTPSLSRFVTPENGDYKGPMAVPGTWLLAVNFAHQVR